MLVVNNGVTMTPPLSSGYAKGGGDETTWVYTCVTTPPSHLIARGPLCWHDNMALLPFNDVYIPTLQWAERQLRNEPWTLLRIGRAQGRQVQTRGYDKTQHKGFLTDLEFIGAFGDDIMAWGPEALKISPRGNPTFDMTAYTPYDRSTSMPPDHTKRFRRISTPRRFEIAATTVPPHLPDLAEQKTLGVRIQIFFPVRGRGGRSRLATSATFKTRSLGTSQLRNAPT